MSRLTRDDYIEMRRCNERAGIPIALKAQEHEELERQTAAFLAKGGFIKHVNVNVSGDESAQRRAVDASKGGKAQAKRFRDTMGITAAARYLGLSRTFLGKLVEEGRGPINHLVDKQRRFLKQNLDTWKSIWASREAV